MYIARIQSGVVAEPVLEVPDGTNIADLFHADLTWIDVTNASPRPAEGWGAVQSGASWTFTPPAVVAISPAQAAAAAYDAFIAAGATVASTGTPALDGVYAIDPQRQSDIAIEAQFISTFGEFTNGGTVDLPWSLANGSVVTFPTTAEFVAFAKQVGQLVGTAKAAVIQGATAMPSPAISIP